MPVEINTLTKVVCDNPGCGTTIEWNEEDLKNNPNALVPAAFRLLVIQPFIGNKTVVCSKQCLLDILRDYVPLSKEVIMQKIAEQEAQEQARQKAAHIGIPMPTSTLDPNQVGICPTGLPGDEAPQVSA